MTIQLQLGCAHFLLSATGGSFLPGRGFFGAGYALRFKGVGKQLDHRLIENRDIIGLAAADPVLVADYCFVAPTTTGIPDIVLKGVVAGEMPALDQSGGNQKLRTVTDDGDRTIRSIHVTDEFSGVFIHAELVGIGDAAREKDGVEVLRRGTVQLAIDRDASPLF